MLLTPFLFAVQKPGEWELLLPYFLLTVQPSIHSDERARTIQMASAHKFRTKDDSHYNLKVGLTGNYGNLNGNRRFLLRWCDLKKEIEAPQRSHMVLHALATSGHFPTQSTTWAPISNDTHIQSIARRAPHASKTVSKAKRPFMTQDGSDETLTTSSRSQPVSMRWTVRVCRLNSKISPRSQKKSSVKQPDHVMC